MPSQETDRYTEEARALLCDCRYEISRAMHENDCAARNHGVVTRVAARLRELGEAREEIGRCNEREAAMEAEAGAWRRDHDRVEYLESLDGEVSLIRWTGRRHGEIKGLGWVLVHDGPGVVSADVSPTVRAALDRAREGAK